MVLAAACVLLVGSPFLPWFEPGYCPPESYCTLIYRPDVTGWEAFRTADLLIALCGTTAAALAAVGLLSRWRLPYLAASLTGWVAVAVAILAVERPANPDATGPTHVGYLLALLSGCGIAISALWAGLRVADKRPG